jgi:hypothetical protein
VPLWLARTIGRGQALLVNGTGLWRWSLTGTDELAGERGRRLWRKTVRWLAEPVQGEPLRVTAERRLVPGREPVRLDALLQDAQFRAVSGADVRGEITGPNGALQRIEFPPGGPGAYTANFPSPGAGRWQVTVRAAKDGRELGRARGEFAVDHWTLEALRAQPDSAAMARSPPSGGSSGAHATRRRGRAVSTCANSCATAPRARGCGNPHGCSPWWSGCSASSGPGGDGAGCPRRKARTPRRLRAAFLEVVQFYLNSCLIRPQLECCTGTGASDNWTSAMKSAKSPPGPAPVSTANHVQPKRDPVPL